MFLRLEFAIINLAHVMWMEITNENLIVLHFSNGGIFPVVDDEAKQAMRVMGELQAKEYVFDSRNNGIPIMPGHPAGIKN